MSKDLFSDHAVIYSKYRPSYPDEIINYLLKNTHGRELAWDVATGNGQFATLLSAHYEKVMATDISEQQLLHVINKSNIHYSKQPAEKTNFPDNYFDLITVAQAYHWFQFDLFEKEVKRVGRPDGVIALVGYNLLSVADEKIEAALQYFYGQTLEKYWDPERRYLDANYRSIPFNFSGVEIVAFSSRFNWTLETFAGYLGSWSGVQHYIKQNNCDPVHKFITSINNYWKEGELKQIAFPLFLKLGRINK